MNNRIEVKFRGTDVILRAIDLDDPCAGAQIYLEEAKMLELINEYLTLLATTSRMCNDE